MPVQKSHSDTFFDLPFMVSMVSLESGNRRFQNIRFNTYPMRDLCRP